MAGLHPNFPWRGGRGMGSAGALTQRVASWYSYQGAPREEEPVPARTQTLPISGEE